VRGVLAGLLLIWCSNWWLLMMRSLCDLCYGLVWKFRLGMPRASLPKRESQRVAACWKKSIFVGMFCARIIFIFSWIVWCDQSISPSMYVGGASQILLLMHHAGYFLYACGRHHDIHNLWLSLGYWKSCNNLHLLLYGVWVSARFRVNW
jgi:hypothetical protein